MVGITSSSLLSALSHAFSYPWNGLEETVRDLRALPDGPWSDRIAAVLETGSRFPDRTAEQLAYTRLFIGSFKMEAPPYASYYLGEDGTLNGWAAAEVASVYAQFGLVLDSGEKAPADHLRYLLAFLALLSSRWEEMGEEAFAEAYADFRDVYLLSWIDQFQERVELYAEDLYYPALVALIVDALKEGD